VSETALVVVVPEAGPEVEFLRREHTRDGAEGMRAHITLLYPFTDTEVLAAGRIDEVRKVLAPFSGFACALTHFARFPEPLEHVLWLAPRPAEPLIAMTRALVAAFPEHPPYGGRFASIVPHLTVAVSEDDDLLARIGDDLSGRLPVEFDVGEVALYEHDPSGWRLRTAIPLGAGA